MKLFRLTATSVVLTTAAIFSLMYEVKASQINSSIPINTVSPDLANQIQKTLARSVQETEIPGAVIGIIGSEGTWFGTSGVSNLETGTAMPIDGLFATGSIGKTFTAVAALKLQEQGTLNLDDTLGKWLPDVASNIPDGNSITIRQLLNGSAGIYDFTNEWEADVIKDQSLLLRQSPEDLLVTYAYGKPRFEGRTCTPIWCYTNTSSMIAGLAMEKATGSSFNSIVRSQIFAPLELDSTFAGGEQPFPPGLVESYGDINGDNQLDNVTKFDVEATNIIGGMGNIFSNAPDLMKFTQEVFGGEFLQPESKQQLLDFVALDPSNPEGVFGFGLGVENLPSPWGRSWGKGGTITGYVGQITYYPDRDVAAVALINGLTPQTETEGVQGTILSPSLNTYLTAEQDNNLESVPEPNGVVGLILLGSLGLWLKRKPLSISRLFK